MLEVELKFPIDDGSNLIGRLEAAGATRGGSAEQVDDYFNHPSRDFAATDEALRVRTVGDTSIVTYKGPKQGGAAKTRFETNLPLADKTTEGWFKLFALLGFCHVAQVIKRRTAYYLEQDGRRFEVSIDEVEGLGLFAEVETLAEEHEREAAEQAVNSLASELGLSGVEPRGYLEMLLSGASGV